MEINDLKRKVDEIRNQNLKLVLYKSNAHFDIPVKEDMTYYLRESKLDVFRRLYNILGINDCAELTTALGGCSLAESETEKECAKIKLAEEMADMLMSIERLKRVYEIDDELINDIYNVKFNRYLDIIELHNLRKKK